MSYAKLIIIDFFHIISCYQWNIWFSIFFPLPADFFFIFISISFPWYSKYRNCTDCVATQKNVYGVFLHWKHNVRCETTSLSKYSMEKIVFIEKKYSFWVTITFLSTYLKFTKFGRKKFRSLVDFVVVVVGNNHNNKKNSKYCKQYSNIFFIIFSFLVFFYYYILEEQGAPARKIIND